MNKQMYALGFDMKMNDYDIEGFLMAVGDALNAYQKTIVKHKVKSKIRHGKLVMKVKVKFIDGTKMTFKHKSKFSLNVPLVQLTEEQLMQELAKQGVQIPPKNDGEYEEKVIGFDTSAIKE